jgi:opacity protein-like surface antigen
MRFTAPVLYGAIAVMAVSLPARAQRPYIFAGAGASFPVSTFGDYAKTGWMAQAGVGVDVGTKGLWVEAEGWYGSNNPSDVVGDKTDIFSLLGAVGYSFMPEKKVTPYVLGGAGFLSHKFEPATGASATDTKFAYSGAAGLSFVASPTIHIFLEARYLGTSDSESRMVPVTAGVSIELGKKK